MNLNPLEIYNMFPLKLNKEELIDLTSLLTYCKNNHPSSELRKIAQELLKKIILDQQSLFSFPLDK